MTNQVLETWARGGWVMWPLLAVCLMMFWTGLRLWLQVCRMPDREGGEAEWTTWVRHPNHASDGVREILRRTQADDPSPHQLRLRFAEVAAALLPDIDRRLGMLQTLVAAAPLVGLLGTVFGMLVTLQALALGGAGQVTEAMAVGISQALFPPEVGLCIALPGLMLVNLIKRRRHEIESFLARLESLTVQHLRPSSPSTTAAAAAVRPALDQCVDPRQLSTVPLPA